MAQLSVCRFPSWGRVFAIITCLWLSGSVLLPTAHAQEAFTVNVSLTSATLAKSGVVTVTGTMTCSEPTGGAWLEAYVSQPVGRLHTVHGDGYDQLEACDVTPVPFTFEVVPYEGQYAPGTVRLTLVASACLETDDFFGDCSSDEWSDSIRIKHAK